MRRLGAPAIALAALCVVLSGCGGSTKETKATGGTTTATGPAPLANLSAGAYRARLKQIKGEVSKSQGAIRRDLSRARTSADVRAGLKRFADEEIALSQRVGRLRPPQNAKRANALLARGFADTAAQIRAILPKISSTKSPRAAFALLRRLHPAGGNEIQRAVAELKKLGYTSGS